MFTPHIFRVTFAGRKRTLRDLTGRARPPTENAKDAIQQRSSSAIDVHVQKKPVHVTLSTSRHGESFIFSAPAPTLGRHLRLRRDPTLHRSTPITHRGFPSVPAKHSTNLGRPVDSLNHGAIGTSNTRSCINMLFFFSTVGYGCFVSNSTVRP
jgi:hypothetical protein